MIHTVQIQGHAVPLEWTQAAARAFGFRASKIGADPRALYRDIKNPLKAEYAVTAFLWMLLPDEEHRKYSLPDDLCPVIDPDHAPEILRAVLGVIADMSPAAEKKSTLRKSPSPGSNLG